jgi:hypothetical protein
VLLVPVLQLLLGLLFQDLLGLLFFPVFGLKLQNLKLKFNVNI